MKQSTFDKFAALERRLSKERGDFTLFGLFQRSESEKWDLVLAAAWHDDEGSDDLADVSRLVSKSLDEEELISLSRIVFVTPDSPAVEAVCRAVSVQHGRIEVVGTNFFGLEIDRAIIITARRPVATPRRRRGPGKKRAAN